MAASIAATLLTVILAPLSSGVAQTVTDPEKNKGEEQAAASWSEVNIERRCEGLLAFFKQQTMMTLPDWNLTKPQCVISGSVDQDLSWSFEASWQKGSKALPLRYIVTESRAQKARTVWCVTKGKKSACAAPWENGFPAGEVFAKSQDGVAAFQGIVKMSSGFLAMATHLDDWVGKVGGELKIFDLRYADWARAWAKSPRSLPVKKEVFIAQFKMDSDSPLRGVVTVKDQIPMELRECLGCGKTACEKTPINFSFWGLGLTLTRELTPEESEISGVKSRRASWVMMESTPFIAREPKWPLLCGTHRVSIQKL